MTLERIERIKERINHLNSFAYDLIYSSNEEKRAIWVDELAGLRLLLAVAEECNECGMWEEDHLIQCDCCRVEKLRRIAEGESQ